MKNNFAKQFNLRIPVIQAPMAGVSTPKFVAAACEAGLLGSLPLGYLSIEQCIEQIHAVKALTQKPFAVNIFVNSPPNYAANAEKISAMQKQLKPYYEELQVTPPLQSNFLTEPNVDELINIVLAEKIPLLSFTFGTLTKDQMHRLKQYRVYVMGTATTLAEATLLTAHGCDAIIAQGKEAGGHRGTFLDSVENSLVPTLELVRSIKQNINIPIIAAGGIMTAVDVVTALRAGATAVQMGTAFITCFESEANPFYKEALLAAKHQSTQLTTVFSGKSVRCLKNRLSTELTRKFLENEIPDYPIQHYLTRDLRRAAVQQRNIDLTGFWAGEHVTKCRAISINDLAIEIEQTLAQERTHARP